MGICVAPVTAEAFLIGVVFLVKGHRTSETGATIRGCILSLCDA